MNFFFKLIERANASKRAKTIFTKNKQGAPIFQARSPIFPHPTRLQGKLTAYRPPGRGSPPLYIPTGKADTVAPGIVQCNPTLHAYGESGEQGFDKAESL